VGKVLPLENALSKGRMHVAAASNVAGLCLVVVTSVLRYVMKVHASPAVFCSRRDVSVGNVKRVCSVGKLSLLVKLIYKGGCSLVRRSVLRGFPVAITCAGTNVIQALAESVSYLLQLSAPVHVGRRN
jgi:hypothetical protein